MFILLVFFASLKTGAVWTQNRRCKAWRSLLLRVSVIYFVTMVDKNNRQKPLLDLYREDGCDACVEKVLAIVLGTGG
ncbi:MAG: hypothetical protein F6J89_16005 [Symploca sp. SIO1C4]|uniref:Uncharacterized protein n=1 Tax=Symploca sp. SIO1C4 TaxID=2607765 RepID=A0A6B3NHG9_9CYAN|nr:hypothetical protein [Symploca sp. SIO1C4]